MSKLTARANNVAHGVAERLRNEFRYPGVEISIYSSYNNVHANIVEPGKLIAAVGARFGWREDPKAIDSESNPLRDNGFVMFCAISRIPYWTVQAMPRIRKNETPEDYIERVCEDITDILNDAIESHTGWQKSESMARRADDYLKDFHTRISRLRTMIVYGHGTETEPVTRISVRTGTRADLALDKTEEAIQIIEEMEERLRQIGARL